jgi:TatD DNase family protein
LVIHQAVDRPIATYFLMRNVYSLERLFATVGCHPTRCGEFESSGDPEAYFNSLLSLIQENREKVVAVGEIGLDYDRTQFCPIDVQKRCLPYPVFILSVVSYMRCIHLEGPLQNHANRFFEKQLELAKKTQLPLFLHCRAAAKDLCDILARHRGELGLGVVHSFDGTPEEADEICKLGFHIGLNGW